MVSRSDPREGYGAPEEDSVSDYIRAIEKLDESFNTESHLVEKAKEIIREENDVSLTYAPSSKGELFMEADYSVSDGKIGFHYPVHIYGEREKIEDMDLDVVKVYEDSNKAGFHWLEEEGSLDIDWLEKGLEEMIEIDRTFGEMDDLSFM